MDVTIYVLVSEFRKCLLWGMASEAVDKSRMPILLSLNFCWKRLLFKTCWTGMKISYALRCLQIC